MIDNAAEVLLKIVSNARVFAYDVETTGLDWKRCSVIGYSVSDGDTSVYVPVRHTGGGNINDPVAFERALNRSLGCNHSKIIGHHLKFDVQFSLNHGVDLRGNDLFCTMVTQALIDEHTRGFSLEKLAIRYGVTPKRGQELYNYLAMQFGCAPTHKSMSEFHRLPGTDEMAVAYAAGDTLSTFQLFHAQLEEIERQEQKTPAEVEHKLQTIFAVENQLTSALVDMERRGITIARPRVQVVWEEVDKLILDGRAGLDNEFINTRSKQDLKDYMLYMGIDDWPVTDAGNPSFTAGFLGATDAGRKVLQVRKLEHFLNTFLVPFVKTHVFKHDGAATVHTSFNQVKTDDYGTVTGRLSSSEPNLQQVPKRDKVIGKYFRSLFVARPGYRFAEMDYSQCEPRLYSHYSLEPRLIEGYKATPFIDMHSIVSKMLGIERDPAKVLNLAILYMMGVAKLARSLNIPQDEAERLLAKWYGLFPFVTRWRKRAIAVAEQRGYVRTILGRRRRFPDSRGAYRAPNAIIQGGSADILKFKIVELAAYIRSLPTDTIFMLLNIHDAVVFEYIDNPQGLAALKECKRIMENVNASPFFLRVPFIADCKTGRTWAEATYS